MFFVFFFNGKEEHLRARVPLYNIRMVHNPRPGSSSVAFCTLMSFWVLLSQYLLSSQHTCIHETPG